MCVAFVTHTIHQYFKIMKKLEYPKWEECRDYLRKVVLPRLQEMQRDLFGNEQMHFGANVGSNGEYISVQASRVGDENHELLYLIMSCVDKREKIESDLTRLTDFIKKYTA